MNPDGSPTIQNNTDLSTQLANLLNGFQSSQNQNTKHNLSDSLTISLKLNNQNYALWARMIRVAIGGKSKTLLGHLSGNPAPPKPSEDGYERWEQDDLVVFSWLIQNIEPTIASNLTEFPTAKALWDALVTTYSSGKDKLQTFDLHVKANGIKQNGTPLEEFWIIMQGIWGEIDRRDPNPMTSPTDITTYNKLRTEQKLFQFLNAIDRQYDTIKREILRMDPLPSAEEAYAAVRKETAHQNILGTTAGTQSGIGAGLATTRPDHNDRALGLAARGQTRRSDVPFKPKIDKTNLKCEHCGMMRHTKDQCFRIVGYPEWWSDGHKKGTKSNKDGGKAAVATNRTEDSGRGGEDSGRSNEQHSGGFGGVAFAGESEPNEGGYQDGNDHWAWH
ncbi:uncharacterized protein LOC118480438 [Helianthus annuus]|uniref:uncharacterized protein LOC118480438 n=1 Tax=Helianthus annuus TaxID=4232 RepID=UPI0016533501|nr:uncharacterized protein LOC118480438 [Helianthus annuus]